MTGVCNNRRCKVGVPAGEQSHAHALDHLPRRENEILLAHDDEHRRADEAEVSRRIVVEL
jgi:hypothetical protein